MIKDNQMRTGDLDYSPNRVKSIFDASPQEEYKLDEKQASTYKPESFELELARQEQERKMQQLEQAVNNVMKRGY